MKSIKICCLVLLSICLVNCTSDDSLNHNKANSLNRVKSESTKTELITLKSDAKNNAKTGNKIQETGRLRKQNEECANPDAKCSGDVYAISVADDAYCGKEKIFNACTGKCAPKCTDGNKDSNTKTDNDNSKQDKNTSTDKSDNNTFDAKGNNKVSDDPSKIDPADDPENGNKSDQSKKKRDAKVSLNNMESPVMKKTGKFAQFSAPKIVENLGNSKSRYD